MSSHDLNIKAAGFALHPQVSTHPGELCCLVTALVFVAVVLCDMEVQSGSVHMKSRTKCNHFCFLFTSVFSAVYFSLLFSDHVQKAKLLKTIKNKCVAKKNGNQNLHIGNIFSQQLKASCSACSQVDISDMGKWTLKFHAKGNKHFSNVSQTETTESF